MADRNILAFFDRPEQAEKALSELKQLALTASSIDRVDGYPGDGSDRIMNPITSDFPGLGYLTLGGDFDSRDAGILAAASVSASGMSSGGEDNEVRGKNIVLTAVVNEKDYEQAMRIVERNGALV
ncbi:hypothetical protein [Paenibacillus humicola]|uniref:hypothetical protein n=1 Tax=Paenibacillus humicola TaxID=3110540 RepID=UPI00237A1AB5|nr:hypothetical protein [Paenibacillus humicola]